MELANLTLFVKVLATLIGKDNRLRFQKLHPGPRVLYEFIIRRDINRLNIALVPTGSSQYSDMDITQYRVLESYTVNNPDRAYTTTANKIQVMILSEYCSKKSFSWFGTKGIIHKNMFGMLIILLIAQKTKNVLLEFIFKMLFNRKIISKIENTYGKNNINNERLSLFYIRKERYSKAISSFGRFINFFKIFFWFFVVKIIDARLLTSCSTITECNLNNVLDIPKYPNLFMIIHPSYEVRDILLKYHPLVLKISKNRTKSLDRKKWTDNDVFNTKPAIYIATKKHLEYFCKRSLTKKRDLHYNTEEVGYYHTGNLLARNKSIRIKEIINERIGRFLASGHETRENWFYNRLGCRKHMKSHSKMAYNSLTVYDFAIVFYFYLYLMIAATIFRVISGIDSII